MALALALGALACAPPSAAPPPAAVRWESGLGADHPLVGVIWDVAARRRVSDDELRARVQAAAIVLVGETHDNPDHHRLEAELLDAFAARHEAPAVVFEMLDRPLQPTVDVVLSAHPGDADALAEAVRWSQSGWPAWSMYRPVFQAALAVHARVVAAGLDRAEARSIAHEGTGALDPAFVQAFGLSRPLPADVQAAARREMSEVHCGLLPDAMLGPMVLVQRARDARLAEGLHEGAASGKGALLVAGAGHVRRDRGVPAQLEAAYGARSLAIGLLEARVGLTTPDAYSAAFDAGSLPFDLVWFTPRASDVDRCAELRERMKMHAKPEGS